MEPVPTWDTLYVFNYRIHIEKIRIFFFYGLNKRGFSPLKLRDCFE